MKITALAGGVGGAKLADGLAQILPGNDLTIVVNTGDDFNFLGLRICPDLDTVCYTIAGLASNRTGWGRENETWQVFNNLRLLGGPDWFQLGDQDLGTHLERTRRLNEGQTLTEITTDFCRAWGVNCSILPMSNDVVATWLKVDPYGWLPFQEYFVRYGCQPRVTAIEFRGSKSAKPAPGVVEALECADLIIVCPSNPFVSIAPILAVEGVRDSMKGKLVLAVSPIIGGKALKGPAAKMFTEFGHVPSAYAVAMEYKQWVTGLVIDEEDREQVEEIAQLGMCVLTAPSVMVDRRSRALLGGRILEWAVHLKSLKEMR